MPAGSAILFLVGAANRDDRKFADADRFDIHREVGSHLTFGYGPHFCLGAALARLEGRVALDEILNRFPEWDVDLADAKLAPTSTVRGWERSPWSRASAAKLQLIVTPEVTGRCSFEGSSGHASFADQPPSTGMMAPVTNDALSDARNAATSATSSGWPPRLRAAFSRMPGSGRGWRP